jgi:hypothetical protein
VSHFITEHSDAFRIDECLKKCHFHFHSTPLAVTQESGNQKLLEISQEGQRYRIFPELIITCLGYEGQNEQYWPDIVYQSGWARQGAKGTLASSLASAQIVADAINRAIDMSSFSSNTPQSINDFLKTKGLLSFTWKNHKTLETLEKEEGQSRGKPREKCLDDRVQLAQARYEERM